MRLALLVLIGALFPQEKPTWPQIVERGQKNLERERELLAAIPRNGFDPAALSRELEGDPEKAAEYVRMQIVVEPVRGFVKGAQGALVSGWGSWADRALLLATLVADKSPRLVKGTLAADKQPYLPVMAKTPYLDDAWIGQVAEKLKIDPERLRKKATDSDDASAAAREKAWVRIRRDLDALAGALQSAGVALPGETASGSDDVWWVRIGDKDFGRPEGAAEKATYSPAQLPAEEVHKLTVRMKIQQGNAETTVLDVSFRTMDLFGRVLTVSNVAGDDPRKLGKVHSTKSKDYLDALAATGVFVPLLSGGGKPVSGHPFDLTGSKVNVKNGSILKLEGALDVFGRLPGGGGEEKKELTGASLEVVRTAPGAAPVSTRRDLLRKGVTGRQRVFDLLALREILVLPGNLRGDFSVELLLRSDIAIKEALLPQIQPKPLLVAKRPSRVNARLYEFALARAAARHDLSSMLTAAEVSGTTLVSFVSRIVDGKPAKVRAGFDILSNPSANVAAGLKGWKEHAAFAAGIVDTALEHEINRAKGPHANASVQLEKAIAASSALRVEKDAGHLRVVVPGTPGSWYEIDPRTGACLGYVDEGGGQDMAEYATLLADTLEEIREWQSLADRINSVLECEMNAIDSADAEASFARCMAGMAIGEAFGWAAGGIIGGAAGDNPFARLGGMGLEDALNDAFSAAMDGAMGGH